MISVVVTLALLAPSQAQRQLHRDINSPTVSDPENRTPLHVLTTLHDAHSLSTEEARRGYPVHVRAVVTYFDPRVDSRRIALFLHDSTGSIYAAVPLGTTWTGRQPLPGTLVDVSGVTAPGDFAPIIDQAHIVPLAASQLPQNALKVDLPNLLSGDEDGQWVQVEGVVHAVMETDRNVMLKIAMTGGSIVATTVKHPGANYDDLVDKWVFIRGNAAPTFNSNRQLTGARLFFPGLETVQAFAPGPLGSFDLPVQPINGLLRFNPAVLWPHRIHIHGAVTLYWPGRTICIQDETGGLCAQTSQTTPLVLGSFTDIVGFTTLAGFRPTLSDATFRLAPGQAKLSPTLITPQQGFSGNNDSDLVQIDGRLIGRADAAGDSNLVLSSDNLLYRVIIPTALAGPNLSSIPIGSRLRITGICSVQVDARRTLQGYGVTQASSFWILVDSPRNVAVLQTPSWWTARHALLVLSVSLCITGVVVVWVVVLRRRVEQQTRELRESRERYRHMAQHDALTGLPTRTVLHDRLEVALERARRFGTRAALLMLDLDRFKQINDSYGHNAGDRILCVIAERISSIVRRTDSVARMGGDEFIVLLNDLTEPDQAEWVAAKIVTALAEPVAVGTLKVPVSVSIGVCAISPEDDDSETPLKRADAAMYRAKARGRSCFQVFTGESGIPLGQPEEDTVSTAVR